MNIKNYTSGIPMETSIARIEQKLAAVGATGIAKMYGDDKRVSSVVFKMPEGGREISIRLPANVEACYEAMWKNYCQSIRRPMEKSKATIREQAERTAWKIVNDWVDIQVSMIVMKQAEPMEVFMPYALVSAKHTLFDRYRESGFKALLGNGE